MGRSLRIVPDRWRWVVKRGVVQLIAGASAGVTGGESQHTWPREFVDWHPGLAKAVIQSGRRPRAGHDRKRWETVQWDDYRAQVGICQRRGPWRIEMCEEKPGTPSQWVADGDGMPFQPGWYTALLHDTRGLVMSDVPAEIAGCLPFLDRVQRLGWQACGRQPAGPTVLISGLGLGVVPCWLLANTVVHRIDIIELDPDVICLVARDPAARDAWAASPRLHIHLGDALTWKPPVRPGCQLHQDCPPFTYADCGWHDIWDAPTELNLPSMRRLHRRYGRRCGWQMSWERPECEYRARHPRSGVSALCAIREDLSLEVTSG
jgi:hypothetical protein